MSHPGEAKPSWWIIFQLAEVAVPRELFAAILERITRGYAWHLAKRHQDK